MRGHRQNESFVARIALPVALAAVVFCVFGLVWMRSSIIAIEYEISAIEGAKADAFKQKNVMEAKLASMLSIQQVGMRGMDLSFPDRQKLVYVKRDTEEVIAVPVSDGREAERAVGQ